MAFILKLVNVKKQPAFIGPNTVGYSIKVDRIEDQQRSIKWIHMKKAEKKNIKFLLNLGVPMTLRCVNKARKFWKKKCN